MKGMNPQLFVLLAYGAKAVLILLVGLSILSVAIILQKRALFAQLKRGGSLSSLKELIKQSDWDTFEKQAALSRGESQTFIQALVDPRLTDPSLIDRSVRSALTSIRISLESGLTVLASIGSNAPFVGLFGTVLGIIHAFAVLGLNDSSGGAASAAAASPGGPSGMTSSAWVMQGVSEALVATAVGLMVAIPAVLFYNLFGRKLKVYLSEAESLKDLYIAQRFSQNPTRQFPSTSGPRP